ncbi:hypothetical protein BJX61DRAFT_550917 [Aspergillus egyptiacus]|nr:hypothetical protein BJX61DRAFT_550917 [Aspergillus egyptiacus]
MEVGVEDVFDLCLDAFPWISNQATRLGLETRDGRFARLGGELFILTRQLQAAGMAATIGPKLVKIAELVSKACSGPRAKADRNEQPLDALRRIRNYKYADNPDKLPVLDDLRWGLPPFVRENPEYDVLLSLVSDCLRTADGSDALSGEESRPRNPDSRYPAQVNNTLYTCLRLYSSCSCSPPHLDYARLRLDAGHDKEEYGEIPFELVFKTSPALSHDEGHAESSRRKQVAFTVPSPKPSSRPGSSSPFAEGPRRVKLGVFCRLIGSVNDAPIHFHIKKNAMNFTYSIPGSVQREFFPQAEIPFSKWLEQTAYLSNRVKVTLAYTIARSVWRYYSSYWMETPWTHDNIQMLEERISPSNHIRPHPYFMTKLYKPKGQIQDYCLADDLLHVYPNVLALAIVLIEIATKKPFKCDSPHHPWDATTINDYYEWAWMTANRSDLRNTVGPAYEKVVNSCLDGELFSDGPFDESRPDKNLEVRQSILYDKIVVPLQELYHAYIDDLDIQEKPAVAPQLRVIDTVASKLNGARTSESETSRNTAFSVAIFCALPLEADAFCELLDEIWDEGDNVYGKSTGDDNTYTLGRMSRHNVVLVHMPGMGKKEASRAASSLRTSYPGIKLALVAGVCGGVPSGEGGEELILGDVVVSDGIVQYDFGRQFPDGFSSKAGPEVIGRPSLEIRGILAKLKVWRNRQRIEMKLAQYLGDLHQTVGAKRAGYPGIDKDELYHSTYRHKHRHQSACRYCSKTDEVCEDARVKTCQQLGCERRMLVPRKRLQNASEMGLVPNPKIHFGFVGSGDTVMKSGEHRDETAAHHGIIAFEMEAAGVWDNLPCLVIKGVCDYADSHKNKHWQNYAAAAAAACTKAILEEYPGDISLSFR